MTQYSLEGASFSGKTTLARQLCQDYAAQMIDGYTKHATHTDQGTLPPPPTSIEEAQEGFDFFRMLERKRSADIRALNEQGLVVISDKSALALVSYQLALVRTRQSMGHNQCAVPEYALESLSADVENGDIVLPEKVVLMSAVNEGTYAVRVQRRGRIALNDVFNHWEFSLATDQAIRDTIKTLLPTGTPLCETISHDGSEQLAFAVRDVAHFFGISER